MSAPRFYNRHTGKIEEESVYGDSALRFIYGNPLGKLALHALVKRAFFSRWYGRRMDSSVSKNQIPAFIEQYGIDMGDFVVPETGFAHFNDFFYRKLAEGARPIDDAEGAVVFPADGRHLLVPDVDAAKDLFIKGQRFDLGALLKDQALEEDFRGGAALISRLCPVDYHRFHFPIAGLAEPVRELDGPLFSVNPLALARVPGVLWRNKRTLTVQRETAAGIVLCMEVGATCVGGVTQTYAPNSPVAKGQEKGYFSFGGSTTVTLFQRGRVNFADDLREQSAEGIELYAKMGEHCASLEHI